ncbi:MAG: NYN domain-containing protein [Lachnospiraceae bacterium]|nr:NYN domain-containing protein [Lachnospiraceae bacterium]
MAKENKFALLIDVDNISPKYLSVMLNEAKSYGVVSVRRAYGDWTDYQKKTWKECLLENSIIPMQQYSYTSGKNSSDSSMIIDAMDILYSDNVDGFIIVSSDSDFTRLAMRLREAGKIVIGMGESKTPTAFVRSCEEFKVLDVLFKNTISEEDEQTAGTETAAAEDSAPEGSPITRLSKIRKNIFEILDKNSDEDGRMLLSELGRLLTKKFPDFDERNYGRYRKFSEFIKVIDGLEIEMVYFDDNKKTPIAYVKKKADAKADAAPRGKKSRKSR